MSRRRSGRLGRTPIIVITGVLLTAFLASVAAVITTAQTSTGAAPSETTRTSAPSPASDKVIGYFTQWGAQRDYLVKNIDTSGPDAFPRLMSALRSRFGSGGLVTAAITADARPGGKLDAADYAGASRYVDWYLPMTYDFFGASGTGGPTAPHSALYTYDGIPREGSSSDAAIRKLKAKGVPTSKLLLGIGFYGRGWTGVTRSAPGGSATGAAPGRHEKALEDYKILKGRCPFTGTVAGTAYAKCGDQWWSYDTPATLGGKMTYARNQGLSGAFIWKLSGDTADGELITAIRNGLG